ncbi:hypothetical protein [Parapedobacter lycopersici]|uniref:hypothetical protein n=1 Tax=Parapedobacter lycopersici TaxID=1864939 RepID=UPI0033401333
MTHIIPPVDITRHRQALTRAADLYVLNIHYCSLDNGLAFYINRQKKKTQVTYSSVGRESGTLPH